MRKTVDPAFRLNALPLDGVLDSLFQKNDFILFYLLENDLELPLIFVLFLKAKQNKKENPNCNSLFEKDGL